MDRNIRCIVHVTLPLPRADTMHTDTKDGLRHPSTLQITRTFAGTKSRQKREHHGKLVNQLIKVSAILDVEFLYRIGRNLSGQNTFPLIPIPL